MAYETSRRDFLKVLGVLGGAAIAGCHSLPNNDGKSLEDLTKEANTFVEQHTEHMNLGFNEVRTAAQYALDLNAKGAKAEAAKMSDIVHYALQNGQGNLAICVNLYHDIGGNRSQKWEGNTKVTVQDLAKDLTVADDKATYFKAIEVLELVAGASEKYGALPNRSVRDYVVKEQGFKILRDVKKVEKILAAGDFQEVNGGEPFTKETHAMLGKNDYRQGVYNRDMPAAVKLVITKTPDYKPVKKD